MSGDSQSSTDFEMDQIFDNEDLLNSNNTMLPVNGVANPSSVNKRKNDCDNIVCCIPAESSISLFTCFVDTVGCTVMKITNENKMMCQSCFNNMMEATK